MKTLVSRYIKLKDEQTDREGLFKIYNILRHILMTYETVSFSVWYTSPLLVVSEMCTYSIPNVFNMFKYITSSVNISSQVTSDSHQ